MDSTYTSAHLNRISCGLLHSLKMDGGSSFPVEEGGKGGREIAGEREL